MPTIPAAAPTVPPSSDFEEDTLLPPPAPGLEVPSHELPPDLAAEHAAIPEHVVDASTLQGFLTTRPLPESDPQIGASDDTVARVLAELPMDRTQRMSLFVPSRLRDDPTPVETAAAKTTQQLPPIDPSATVELPQVPRAMTVRFPTVLPNATAPLPPVLTNETMKLEPVSTQQTMRFPTLPPVTGPSLDEPVTRIDEQGESTAEIARAALSAASTIEMPALPPPPSSASSESLPSLTQSTRSLPKISLPPPSEDTLPQLPLLPPLDTVSGRLNYAISGLQSMLRRRALLRRLRGELSDRVASYERALISLGELAYAEHMELLPHVPDPYASRRDEIPTNKHEALLQVQSAAERFLARSAKDQRALARREALLASELRVLRHRRDELYQRLVLLAQDSRSEESGSDERYSLGMELATIEGDSHKVALRLGEVRSDLRLLRRQNHHFRSRREQLLYALSLDYAEEARRSPHLLILGALTTGFRPQPVGKDKRARFDSLYALLDGLRGGIAKVEARLALLLGDRRAADQKALRMALAWLAAVVLIVGGGFAALAYYLLAT